MFNAPEIKAIQHSQPAYSKIQSLLEAVQPAFEKHFGSAERSLQQDQKYLNNEGWFGIYKQRVLAGGKHSTLFFGLGRARTCYQPWVGLYLQLDPETQGLHDFQQHMTTQNQQLQGTTKDEQVLSEVRNNEQEWILFFFQRLSYFEGADPAYINHWSSQLISQIKTSLAEYAQFTWDFES